MTLALGICIQRKSFLLSLEINSFLTVGIYRSHCITNTSSFFFFFRFIIKDSHTNNHLFLPRNLVHLSLLFTSSKTLLFLMGGFFFFPAAKEIYFDVKGEYPSPDEITAHPQQLHPISAQTCLNHTRISPHP